MAECVVEKKVRFIGSWSHNSVNKDVIAEINAKIVQKTGNNVKLQLWRDGIRVLKTSLIQGKILHELIPFPSIHFLTVSQNTPDFLVVIAKSRDPNFQYQIYAFRCASALDASLFIDGFRSITKSIEPGHGFNPNIKTHDGINWTLRENEKKNDTKRELNQLVNIHSEKPVIHSNGGVSVNINEHQYIKQNGEASPTEYKVHMYRKGKPAHVQRSHEFGMRNGLDNSDSHSEVSESALRTELESLSQELKDIKLMIEKSTGLTATKTVTENRVTENKVPAPREFEPLHIKVHTTTVPYSEVIQNHVEDVESPKTPNVLAALDAVVQYEDDDSEDVAKTYIHRTEEDPNVIRVTVPDYRTPSERVSGTTTVISETPRGQRLVAKRSETSGYGSVSSGTATMSYENWKRSTMGNDMSERIQWRARSHTTPRPRTAIPSFSGDSVDSAQYVQVRHHTHAVPQYQRVSFDPRVSRMGERKTKSLRLRGISTTVAKPIEKVYVRDSGHHSLVYRPHSAVRPALVVQNGPIENGTAHVVAEQNNNVVKMENSDHTLLDVSGIDLYKETPTAQAVIRT